MLRSQVRILLGAWMCVCVSLCCVVLCVGRGLVSGRSPVQGVLPIVCRFTSKNPSTPQGKRGRLRKKERKKERKLVSLDRLTTLNNSKLIFYRVILWNFIRDRIMKGLRRSLGRLKAVYAFTAWLHMIHFNNIFTLSRYIHRLLPSGVTVTFLCTFYPSHVLHVIWINLIPLTILRNLAILFVRFSPSSAIS
jgi:hypothetical protein